jgi:hypothetical protein
MKFGLGRSGLVWFNCIGIEDVDQVGWKVSSKTNFDKGSVPLSSCDVVI